MAPAAQYRRLHDPASRLDGMIVIHSTALGPGAGGCRLWSYASHGDAFADAFRLAEGMSYKNAMAGLPFGGAKAVLRRPEGAFDRAALFRAFGEAVERMGGCYVTAEDVGTTVADMEVVAKATRHVAGLAREPGRAGGDPSPWTARGVFAAMRAATRLVFGSELEGRTVAVQGLGSVGAQLCRLLADAGARLVIADIDGKRCARLQRELDARVVKVTDIALTDADIFAPCALGGVLTRRTVSVMKARVVCGAANNQLAVPPVAAAMVARRIAYVPDYVANAGGIISVAAEYLREDEASVGARVARIGGRVDAILKQALDSRVSPAIVADRMAEHIMDSAAEVNG